MLTSPLYWGGGGGFLEPLIKRMEGKKEGDKEKK